MNISNIPQWLVGVFVVSILIPILVFSAGGGGGGGVGSGSGGGAITSPGQGVLQQDQTQDRIRDPTTHTGDEPLQKQDQDRDRLYQSTTTPSPGIGQTTRGSAQNGEAFYAQPVSTVSPTTTSTTTLPSWRLKMQYQNRLQIDPEYLHVQERASNGSQLQQMTQERAQELARQASTTPQEDRVLMQAANRVRLGIYSVLAAEDIIPGIVGQQMSQLANQIDELVPLTANIEAQVKKRSFLTRFFFGGDAQSGQALSQLASENQTRIQQMMQLLALASSTPAIQSQLMSQLEIMKQEQVRLQEVGEQEQTQRGLFSWRR